MLKCFTKHDTGIRLERQLKVVAERKIKIVGYPVSIFYNKMNLSLFFIREVSEIFQFHHAKAHY